jgi:hypothetical protein
MKSFKVQFVNETVVLVNLENGNNHHKTITTTSTIESLTLPQIVEFFNLNNQKFASYSFTDSWGLCSYLYPTLETFETALNGHIERIGKEVTFKASVFNNRLEMQPISEIDFKSFGEAVNSFGE